VNGKVDRNALLKSSEGSITVEDRYVAPRTDLEKSLCKVWEEVLGVKRVGITDNFFNMGGHSLLATSLLSKIRSKHNVEVPLKAIFNCPILKDLADDIENKYLTNKLLPPIKVRPKDGPIPLSYAQQRLWFMEKLFEGKSLYHMPTVLKIEGDIDKEALRKSLDHIVARHEILRTKLISKDGEGEQIVLKEARFNLEEIGARLDEVKELLTEEIHRPFKFEKEVLCRGLLIKVLSGSEKHREHILVLTFHHVISDGWSVGIFNRELSQCYEKFSNNKEPDLTQLPVQYGDYSVWQKSWLQKEVLHKQLSYWKENLVDAQTLNLPTDRERPKEQSHRGRIYTHHIDKETTAKLNKLSKKEGVTLYMVLLAVFNGVLSKLSNQNDIVVGTPIANRRVNEIEGLIGFFVNTLVIRTSTENNPTFKELLKRVETTTLNAYEHQDAPFEQLVECLNIPRDLSRHPLFQVMFILQNVGDPEKEEQWIKLGNARISHLNIEGIKVPFDLTLDAIETQEGLSIRFEYAKDLFDEITIKKIAGYYTNFLNSILVNKNISISAIEILDNEELQVLQSWNDTKADYPKAKCIHQLFEETVEINKDRIAVVYEGKQITYDEINKRSNQLAYYLRKRKIGSDVLVSISMLRSIELIIGILGILKSGGAYVPLDSDYPEKRLNYMLEDSEADMLLTTKECRKKFNDFKGKLVIFGEKFFGEDLHDREGRQLNISQYSDKNLNISTPSESLAYIIYTSGSTGEPKGVGVSSRALAHHIWCMQDLYSLSDNSNVLQKASCGFDVSIWEIFAPLVAGGKMVFMPNKDASNMEAIKKVIIMNNINRL
jgi:non-ribosomal peptide synthetase component F/acyl carrier protein